MFNNYGYNPYYQQQRFQGIEQQPQQQMMTTYQQPMQLTKVNNLLGKSVDNIDVVKAMDIPLDGSISYFPLTDGSAIVSKQLQNDGTSKIIVYKPTQEDKKEAIQFATLEDIQDAINEIDLSDIQDLKDDIKEIKKQLKEMKPKKSKEEE
jgi:IMP dehydrogenase/GMP reductase